ncbi:MAG TPA: hypothetical protein DD706_20395 [Nitrospiraceae bacterium]|nr:hypothetical protein [Nitrospiraceae bacterium]
MSDLIKGFDKFHEEIYHNKQGLFEKLAHHQEPQVLFITYSDSRINAHLLTQAEPGDLFILRNAATARSRDRRHHGDYRIWCVGFTGQRNHRLRSYRLWCHEGVGSVGIPSRSARRQGLTPHG